MYRMGNSMQDGGTSKKPLWLRLDKLRSLHGEHHAPSPSIIPVPRERQAPLPTPSISWHLLEALL